uniref:uncharacterized protein LOC122586102 n=1 Tax=Erigeron canadensis TaxID=72917 RepID=UPI001CB9A217|nr:uncharacterized protein LOC122586102 [Erigeron canadensis]
MHQGPILEFTVDMVAGYNCFELDQIIVHLSRRNTITELKLMNGYADGAFEQYAVPFSIYSLHQLTYLRLFDCYIKHKPTFSGFGSLTTLCLESVSIAPKTLLHLLSKSSLLKRVNLYLYYQDEDGHMPFIDLLECIHLVEHLKIGDSEWIKKCLIVEEAPQKLPTSLVHLKKVSFEMCFNSKHGLSIIALLIKSSPNLERIKLGTLWYRRD